MKFLHFIQLLLSRNPRKLLRPDSSNEQTDLEKRPSTHADDDLSLRDVKIMNVMVFEYLVFEYSLVLVYFIEYFIGVSI